MASTTTYIKRTKPPMTLDWRDHFQYFLIRRQQVRDGTITGWVVLWLFFKKVQRERKQRSPDHQLRGMRQSSAPTLVERAPRSTCGRPLLHRASNNDLAFEQPLHSAPPSTICLHICVYCRVSARRGVRSRTTREGKGGASTC
jgi:hypothetical protein